MMTCLRAMATGFLYQKSNAPKEPQKYITEPTLPTWEEITGFDSELTQKQNIATDEELNMILYGDPNYVEE